MSKLVGWAAGASKYVVIKTLDTMGGVETTTPFAVPMLAATLGVLISVLAVVKIGDR